MEFGSLEENLCMNQAWFQNLSKQKWLQTTKGKCKCYNKTGSGMTLCLDMLIRGVRHACEKNKIFNEMWNGEISIPKVIYF
jgi:hypothetical protein